MSDIFVTPWTVHGFSRQEYWSGLLCPPPWDLPNPEIEPKSPTLKADSLSLSHSGSPTTLLSGYYYCEPLLKLRKQTQKVFPKNIQLVSGTTRIWTQAVWFQSENLLTLWIKRHEKRWQIFSERLNDLISVLVIRGKIQTRKTYVQITSNAI